MTCQTEQQLLFTKVLFQRRSAGPEALGDAERGVNVMIIKSVQQVSEELEGAAEEMRWLERL